MTVKQISVFLENKPGRLAEFIDILSENKIDMRAMSIAETQDFGILRIIVDDPEKTAEVVKASNCVFSITPVLAVAIPDEPGALSDILHTLAKNEISLEYTYAFITRQEKTAYMVFRVADNDKATEVLSNHGIKLASQDELFKI
ncbi:MAG: ACT domain-containing protein [Bacillota bacterium]|nr:ACT domain-containing protein [Bacillota bacterium]